jgi:hypothetical protein
MVAKYGIYYPVRDLEKIRTHYVLASSLFPFIDWKVGNPCVFKGAKSVPDGTVGTISNLTPETMNKIPVHPLKIGVKLERGGQEIQVAVFRRVLFPLGEAK